MRHKRQHSIRHKRQQPTPSHPDTSCDASCNLVGCVDFSRLLRSNLIPAFPTHLGASPKGMEGWIRGLNEIPASPDYNSTRLGGAAAERSEAKVRAIKCNNERSKAVRLCKISFSHCLQSPAGRARIKKAEGMREGSNENFLASRQRGLTRNPLLAVAAETRKH